MDSELRKLNRLFQKDLKPSPSSSRHSSGLRRLEKIIAGILILIILFSLVLFLPIGKREMVISGEGKNKTIIYLGQIGLVIPSFLKNKERINLLFLGIPGQGYSGENLTDTIIIINSSPRGENPIAISIPRDFFVKFPEKNYYTKINSLYKWGQTKKQGIELTATSIKEITDLDINYFLILDLEGVKKLVDKLGGIDVMVENDIYDPQFPAPWDSYELFSLTKGTHHLDGETALKYIRTRHGPEGDFDRIRRQQQVINILKNRILDLNPIWNLASVLSIWKTLNKHTYTNIGLTDIKYAWNLIKKTNFDKIKFITLDNQLLISDQVILGDKTAFILKPKAGIGNYEEIREYINQLIKNQ